MRPYAYARENLLHFRRTHDRMKKTGNAAGSAAIILRGGGDPMKSAKKPLSFLLPVILAFCIACTLIVRTDEAVLYKAQTTAAPSAPSDNTLTITFVGDCMFASDHGTANEGSFNRMAQENPPEYFLQDFIRMFRADDFTIANCECVLSDSEDLQEKASSGPRSFWFKGPASNAEIFRAADVQFASVVNNHSHDFGQQGSDDTVAALESVGILPGKRDVVTYATVKGQKLGVFCDELVSDDQVDGVLEKVREMQQADCDLIILYFHSGIEYATAPEAWLVRVFHTLIDAGVDIIASSHPHVIQPMEVYNGKPILYSLGNFCFGGNLHPPKDTVVYQAVYQLEDGSIGERRDVLIPCATHEGDVNDYRPRIVTDEEKRQEILQFMQTPVEA